MKGYWALWVCRQRLAHKKALARANIPCGSTANSVELDDCSDLRDASRFGLEEDVVGTWNVDRHGQGESRHWHAFGLGRRADSSWGQKMLRQGRGIYYLEGLGLGVSGFRVLGL